MITFIPRTNKKLNKASKHFLKLCDELDTGKYKLDKYRELFMLASFQAMHDADLAYNDIYTKCSQNAQSKESLLQCLAQEEHLLIKNPESFDGDIYRLNVIKAIAEIKLHILNGDLDYLYM